MPQLPKAYTPHDVEGAIYERWLAADVFAPDGAGSTADPSLPPFTIIQPPPNITGSLHLGHAQRTAVEDLMIRHARMRGHPTLFLPGLDHASISAQFVLDGILAKEGENRQSLGRERYLERMRRVRCDDPRGDARAATPGRRLVRLGSTSLHDGRRIGEGRARRVQAPARCRPRVSHRGPRQLVPGLPDERQRPRGHRRHPRPGRSGRSATTSSTPRPASPIRSRRSPSRRPAPRRSSATPPWPSIRDDPRYAALVGRTVRIPFVERDVPIIADDVVDPAFGTGAVKITPAHDHDDHETGLRHGLPAPTVLADDASITETGTRYDGMDRYVARGAIVADLDGARRSGRDDPARDGHRPVRAQRRRRRTAAQDPVVRPDRPARGACPRGDPPRPDADPAGALREDLGALADQHPRLERLAPAVVGSPHPGLVLPRRPRDGVRRARWPGRLRRLRPPALPS